MRSLLFQTAEYFEILAARVDPGRIPKRQRHNRFLPPYRASHRTECKQKETWRLNGDVGMNGSVVNNTTNPAYATCLRNHLARIATSPTIATSPLLTRRWLNVLKAATPGFPSFGV
jgi:hypothetical protein